MSKCEECKVIIKNLRVLLFLYILFLFCYAGFIAERGYSVIFKRPKAFKTDATCEYNPF